MLQNFQKSIQIWDFEATNRKLHSSHIWRIGFQNSLSLLTFGEFIFKILFLLLKLEKRISISLSLLEKGEPFCKFLFLFSKLEKGISNFSSLLEI